jgi:hypothetical protein
MSRESLSFPEQFDRDVTDVDLLSDPDFLRWSAELEAQSDVDNRIGLDQGLSRLRSRGASVEEIDAYLGAFNSRILDILGRRLMEVL